MTSHLRDTSYSGGSIVHNVMQSSVTHNVGIVMLLVTQNSVPCVNNVSDYIYPITSYDHAVFLK